MKAGTYHHTEETLEKIRESNRRRVVSLETRLKMGQSGKGKHPNIGSENPCWKGGRKIHDEGYIMIYLYPDHPYYALAGSNGYALEHRIVMAKHLGRLLKPFPIEIVDHKDGNKSNNIVENLRLMTQGEHRRMHYEVTQNA